MTENAGSVMFTNSMLLSLTYVTFEIYKVYVAECRQAVIDVHVQCIGVVHHTIKAYVYTVQDNPKELF